MQWAVLKCRSHASRLPELFTTSRGCKFADTRAKCSTNYNRMGVLTNHSRLGYMIQNRTFLKDAEIHFAEINDVRIKGYFLHTGI